MTQPLQWARVAVGRIDQRARLADQVALHLRLRLPDDHLVIARHAPRDRGDRVPVVVIGRNGLVVIEPREDEGDLVCYQDHWYRRIDGRVGRALDDPPSLRARANAARIKRDLGSGGFIDVPIEPLVLLTRGRPDDVRSSCVPVIAGLDPLARHLQARVRGSADPSRVQALAAALAENIKLALQ